MEVIKVEKKSTSKDLIKRQWFCRISKTNKIKETNTIYEYDFDKIYNDLCNKYDNVLMIEHNKTADNIHAHISITHHNGIRKSTLINKMPYGDIEEQKGSNADVIQYMQHIDSKSIQSGKDTYDKTDIKYQLKDMTLEEYEKLTPGKRLDLMEFNEKRSALVEDILNFLEEIKPWQCNMFFMYKKYGGELIQYKLERMTETLIKERKNTFTHEEYVCSDIDITEEGELVHYS